MNESAEHPSAAPEPNAAPTDPPRYPMNRVVGAVPTREQAEAAVNELTTRGFLPSEVGIVSGPSAADALDATTGRRGLGNLAMKIGEWIGVSNHEMDIKELYEQALRDGQFVVGALAPDDERKELASKIIASNGARFVHYFNRFSIERIHG